MTSLPASALLRTEAGQRARWARRALITIALAYCVFLVLVAILLRFCGEGWWLTGAGLYLPRAVLALPLPFIVIALWAGGLRPWLLTQALAAALVIWPLMGMNLSWPTRASSLPSLRVLSYNVNLQSGGAASIEEEIAKFSPDIVFLQEVSANPEETVEMLHKRYSRVETSNQFILATSLPVISVVDPDRLPFFGNQRSPRFMRYTIDTPLGRIAFYNVHPLSPRQALAKLRGSGLRHELLSGRFFSAENNTEMQINSSLRSLQVSTFSEMAGRETDPVVIAGDTNLPGLSSTFHRYLSRYRDAFTDAGSGFGYTFPSGRAWMRIDRIMASDQLRFVRFEVGTSTGSDHRCVVADLQKPLP